MSPDARDPVRSVGIDACPLQRTRTGVANYIIPLLHDLCRRFTQVRFLLYSNWKANLQDLPPNAVLRCQGRPMQSDIRWRNTRMLRMVAEDGPDVFWATEGMLPFWGLGGVRRVLTLHDLVHHFAPETQTFRTNIKRYFVQKVSVLRASCTIAVSAATARDMRRIYGHDADLVIHPPPGARFHHFSRHTLEGILRGLALPQRFWLCVGTLEPRKNLVSLIRAYEACRRAGADLPMLVLAGSRGWKDEQIMHEIQSSLGNGHVCHLGYVDDSLLPALYAACEVFFMPSLYEGFGMPILEAQMCGAPVVHGAHDSMREAGGGLGICVEPDQASLQLLLARLARGEIPLVCRLPTDPSIQTQADAVDRMAEALGLAPRTQECGAWQATRAELGL